MKNIDTQASKIESNLMKNSEIKKSFEKETASPLKNREIVALIAYLQRLGTDTQIKNKSN
jgi:cytochrome c oxidase cbb3-type subunit I/II